jgi:hypothetical protein
MLEARVRADIGLTPPDARDVPILLKKSLDRIGWL